MSKIGITMKDAEALITAARGVNGGQLMPDQREAVDRLESAVKVRKSLVRRSWFPRKSPDHHYRCAGCGKNYMLSPEMEESQDRRAICSEACEFAFIGIPKPEGRRWIGFTTVNPYHEGRRVYYLGVAKIAYEDIGEHEAECYWFDRGRDGDFVSYWGDGVNERLMLSVVLARHSDGLASVFELHERPENWIEESWRSAANTKECWTKIWRDASGKA